MDVFLHGELRKNTIFRNSFLGLYHARKPKSPLYAASVPRFHSAEPMVVLPSAGARRALPSPHGPYGRHAERYRGIEIIDASGSPVGRPPRDHFPLSVKFQVRSRAGNKAGSREIVTTNAVMEYEV